MDDQAFEREEVKAAWPQIAVLDAARYESIPGLDGCRVPVTEESINRRLMYRQQQKRNQTLESYSGDYLAFLKECNLQMELGPLRETNLDRIFELAQRTNQLNFSGNRYSLSQLKTIMQSEFLDTYVIKCNDKFGSYGIVGFSVVDSREPRLLDLMFSCRIQGKRVEHAFLSWLLKRYADAGSKDFYADYRETAKNSAAGKVFVEVGFESVLKKDGLESKVFKKSKEIPYDRLITIIAEREMERGTSRLFAGN